MGPRPTVKRGKAKDAFAERCERLLAPLGPVEARRMFGGAGLFRHGLMFALVSDGEVYLKADDTNRPRFEAEGLGPFVYHKQGKPFSLSYYRLPESALEDSDELAWWSREAIDAALRADRAKPKKRKKPNKT